MKILLHKKTETELKLNLNSSFKNKIEKLTKLEVNLF